jgi:hypothetical protein
MLTRVQARDEILALVKGVTDTITDLLVVWDDTKQVAPDPAAAGDRPRTWVRATVQHLVSEQAALAGADSQRMYTRRGLVTLQLFTPNGDGLVSNDTISTQLQEALQGISSPGGVWFRNARANEVGQTGPWFQSNILTDFEYDSIA